MAERSRGVAGLAGVEMLPLGDVREDVLGEIAVRARAALGTKVVLAEPVAVPEAAYRSSRGQYDASMILNAMRPSGLTHGWKRLAVADVDLFSGNLNFVFGQADLAGPTAVISLARLRNEFYGLAGDPRLLVERAVKEVVHELGHTMGLGHCRDLGCVMYFSNSLLDTDRKGTAYCPGCLGKLAAEGKK
jgi:archaemetzincin